MARAMLLNDAASPSSSSPVESESRAAVSPPDNRSIARLTQPSPRPTNNSTITAAAQSSAIPAHRPDMTRAVLSSSRAASAPPAAVRKTAFPSRYRQRQNASPSCEKALPFNTACRASASEKPGESAALLPAGSALPHTIQPPPLCSYTAAVTAA